MGKHKCCSSILKWRREQVTSRQCRPTSVTLKKEHAQWSLCSDGKQIMSQKSANCGFYEIPALVTRSSCIHIIYLDPEGCNPAVDQRLLLPEEVLLWEQDCVRSPGQGVFPGMSFMLSCTPSALLVGSELRNTHLSSCGGLIPPQLIPAPALCQVGRVSASLSLLSTVLNKLI